MSTEDPSEEHRVVFWPRDLLAEECGKARILVWGYNSRPVEGVGAGVDMDSIFQHGRNLAFALRRERRQNVPIIFIAHSLGGIVMKEVFISAWLIPVMYVANIDLNTQCLSECDQHHNVEFSNIAQSTKAVVFLGTPHRGSRKAALGDVIRKAAGIVMSTNPAILNSLQLKNEDLRRCQASFSRVKVRHSFTAKTFMEGRDTPSIKSRVCLFIYLAWLR